MKPGDRLYKLFNRPFGYEVRLPAPPTLANIENHLVHLRPESLLDNLDIVELEVVTVRPARDTERCPPPMAEEEFDRHVRDTMETLPGEDGKAAE